MEEQKRQLDPKAMQPQDLASLLSRLGGCRLTREMIEADLLAGAPVNEDGTINLVHYAAWLLKEMRRGD